MTETFVSILRCLTKLAAARSSKISSLKRTPALELVPFGAYSVKPKKKHRMNPRRRTYWQADGIIALFF